VLVAVQVGLAVVLLVQISLFARTAWNFRTMESGFVPQGVLTFRMDLPEARYTRERTSQFYRELLTRIDALPGIVSSATINRLPVADRELSARIRIDDAAPVQEDALPFIALATVSPRYLETMRIPLVRGRRFNATDFIRSGAPVALVSEEAARLFWPGRDPVGTQATIVASDMPATPLQVVGVVANVRRSDADQRTMPPVYVPSALLPERAMAIVVRTESSDPTLSVPAIRAQAAALEPDEPIFDAASMEQVLFNDQASLYSLSGLLGAIAFVALCLAGVGIYGVVSFMVTQRVREIGLRMALGARPGTVLRRVMQQAARPVAGGGLLGVPAAVALVYAMSGVFSLIDVRDPATYVGVALAISIVAAVATYVPARRAARVDPLVALRNE
jgi:putative ABC transport system permease protein